jgi:hypothetical protein
MATAKTAKKSRPAKSAAPKKTAPPKAAPRAAAPKKAAPRKAASKAAAARKAAPQKAAARKGGGVKFKDAGFRLTVISSLLDLGHFKKELAAAEKAGGDVDDYEIDPVVQRAVDGFALTPELLARVKSISPDGGDILYNALIPVWDGESDEFDIKSLEDVSLLPNLEKVSLHAMCAKGLDLMPLAGAPRLKELRTSLGKGWVKGLAVHALLKKRGVSVTAH